MTSVTQPTVHPLPAGAIVNIKLGDIVASPFNPRKDFDKEGIAELAESIKAQGLLENLVVRAGKKAGTYELMGGERRFRALQLLKAEDAACKVLKADDAAAMAIQIVENLQRLDLGAMEEADAFDKLNKADPAKWSTAAIAAVIGKTPRFVQQRLALKRNLAPETAQAMKDGDLKIEAARVLAAAPASLQKKVIERHWDIENMSADDAREQLARHAVPEASAAFDIKLYDGEWIEDGKKRLFADVDKFDALQDAAAKALVETLKAKWPKAKIITHNGTSSWGWGDTKECLAWSSGTKKKAGELKVAKDKCTAVVWITRDRKLCSAEGVAAMSEINAIRNSNSGSTSSGLKRETETHKAGRLAYNEALRAGAAKKPEIVKRMTIIGLLLNVTNGDVDEDGQAALAKAMPEPLRPFVDSYFYDSAYGSALKAMAKMKPDDLDRAIALLAVAELNWPEYRNKPDNHVAEFAAKVGVKFVEPKPDPAKASPPAAAKPVAKKATAKAKAVKKKKGAK